MNSGGRGKLLRHVLLPVCCICSTSWDSERSEELASEKGEWCYLPGRLEKRINNAFLCVQVRHTADFLHVRVYQRKSGTTKCSLLNQYPVTITFSSLQERKKQDKEYSNLSQVPLNSRCYQSGRMSMMLSVLVYNSVLNFISMITLLFQL